MSRLDDLRNEEKDLLDQLKNWELHTIYLRKAMGRPENYSKKDFFSFELNSNEKYAQRDRERLNVVRKEIAEEEKRIAAQKARSFRPLNRKPALCPRCEGTGYETIAGYHAFPMPYRKSLGHVCRDCHGTGYIDDED